MTIEESRKVFAAGWNHSAKLCNSCKSAASLGFCRADAAFLCVSCDAKMHETITLASRHERVLMCEVCEQAPASVTCKADAAALCVTCDRDIHTANPLARRHERFPVIPFYESAASALKSKAVNFLVPDGLNDEHRHHYGKEEEEEEEEDEDDAVTCREEAEAASWLLPNPNPNPSKLIEENPDLKSGGGGGGADFFFTDVDPYLDLDYASRRFQNGSGTDSVVPVQPDPHPAAPLLNPSSFDLDFSKPSSYSYTASLSQSVSSSSMEVGVVPDTTDITNRFMTSGSVDASSGGVTTSQPATQLTGLDREARVLRYREKRKNRKFEKTIRYASRKAYAETRPRIKGRFAKRTEIETEVDRLYSSTAAGLMVDRAGYGVVPSF